MKFIPVIAPFDGVLYRARDGRMYRLKEGEPDACECACRNGNNCHKLNKDVFGESWFGWYWVLVEEEEDAPAEPPKPWPRVGDEYFCITTEGRVGRDIFDMHKSDRKLQEFGNFFRTEEEAKAALERVKQALRVSDGSC